MSRPFSYNDENFTVIGNLLFIHLRDDDEHNKLDPVLLIPPAIYERMLTNSFMLSTQLAGNNVNTNPIGATTIEVDNKHFIAFLADRRSSSVPRYYIGFSQMKDI